jgi:hypothetical protein
LPPSVATSLRKVTRGLGVSAARASLRLAVRDHVLEVGPAALAERKGFEPSIPLPVYTLSRGAPSTTRPPPHSALFAFRRGAFLAGFRNRASLKRGAVEKACKTAGSDVSAAMIGAALGRLGEPPVGQEGLSNSSRTAAPPRARPVEACAVRRREGPKEGCRPESAQRRTGPRQGDTPLGRAARTVSLHWVRRDRREKRVRLPQIFRTPAGHACGVRELQGFGARD